MGPFRLAQKFKATDVKPVRNSVVQKLGIPRESMRRIHKNDLQLYLSSIQIQHQFTQADMKNYVTV